MNDDHSLVAFTLDIGNTEVLTGAVKDMNTGQLLPGVKLDRIGQLEFGKGRKTLFYTETDEETNRPNKVKKLDLETLKETSIYVDDDPTHYVDIGVTKDQKYLIISSNTKEDSEIWVISTDEKENAQSTVPIKLVPRVKDVRAHIDHLRDFFVTITTLGSKNKNYRIATLKDKYFDAN